MLPAKVSEILPEDIHKQYTPEKVKQDFSLILFYILIYVIFIIFDNRIYSKYQIEISHFPENAVKACIRNTCLKYF